MRQIGFAQTRVLTTTKYQIDRMLFEQAIPYAEMGKACDELLLAVLKSKKYDPVSLDKHGRVVFRSRSSNFVLYIDVYCLGAEPGEFQVFAYSLTDFRYGPQRQNRGKPCWPDSNANRRGLLSRKSNRYQFGVEQVEFAFEKREFDSDIRSDGIKQEGHDL